MFKHVQILLEPELRDASGFQCRRHSRHRGSGLSLCQCSMATAHGARHTPLLHYTLQPQNYLRVSMYNIYIYTHSLSRYAVCTNYKYVYKELRQYTSESFDCLISFVVPQQ